MPETGIALSTGQQVIYTLNVTAGATDLLFTTAANNGDADLYVRFGSAPTTATYDCRGFTATSNESCPIATAQEGTYYVMVDAYSSFTGLALEGSYTAGGPPPPPPPPPSCAPKGASCTVDADCCSNKCRGGNNKSCK